MFIKTIVIGYSIDEIEVLDKALNTFIAGPNDHILEEEKEIARGMCRSLPIIPQHYISEKEITT